MPVTITVNPKLLSWARERADLDYSSLAGYLNLRDPNQVEMWERTGEIRLNQLEKLAKKAYVPIGYMFLDSPPADNLPIPDFRTRVISEKKQASSELIDLVNYSKFRQDWYERKVIDNYSDLNYVSTVTVNDDVVSVAKSIRTTLGINNETFAQLNNWEESLRLFVERTEDAGILVMRSGIVGNNTRRKLDVNEFRGFTLSSRYSPLIFINSNDSKSAQMFTLAHELTHVWMGQSGVSNLSFDYKNKIESFCNKVAAEVLIPTQVFLDNWERDQDTNVQVKRLAKLYKVSFAVVLIKALQNGLIKSDIFDSIYEREFTVNERPRSNGGDFYLTQGVRLGKRFIGAVVADTLEGNTTYVEAFQLLGIRKSTTFNRMVKMIY